VVIGCNEMDSRRGVHTCTTLCCLSSGLARFSAPIADVPTFVGAAIWVPAMAQTGQPTIRYWRIGGALFAASIYPSFALDDRAGEDFTFFRGLLVFTPVPSWKSLIGGRFSWGTVDACAAWSRGFCPLSVRLLTRAISRQTFRLRET